VGLETALDIHRGAVVILHDCRVNVLGSVLDPIRDILPIFYHLSLLQDFFCPLSLQHLLLSIITEFSKLDAPLVYVEHPYQPYRIFNQSKKSKCNGTEEIGSFGVR
jgi:hypothetical protein